ncbi:MAG: FlgD immunoglobulin-like domain containing protein [Gemmatimonadota bacterium]
MSAAFRTALLVSLALVSVAVEPSRAEVRSFRIPGDISWREAQQTPWPTIKSPKFYLNPIDFDRDAAGIAPLAPFRTVQVPSLPASLASLADLDSVLTRADSTAMLSLAGRLGWTASQVTALRQYLREVGLFGRNVARNDVVAAQPVLMAGREAVAAGQVLVSRFGDLPKAPQRVRLLRDAGVAQVEVLINVAESWPKPTTADPPPSVLDNFNKAVNLTSVGIFEVALRIDSLEAALGEVFDGDPISGFDRTDRPGQTLKKKFVLYIDLDQYFPIALVRSFPRPDNGLRLSSYVLRGGVPGTEKEIPGLNLFLAGNVGFPKFASVGGTFPTFVELEAMPVNPRDTMSVRLDPPRSLRYLRLDASTDLDYQIAEIQAYADGFLPRATYVTKPMALPPATVGRIQWDEEVLGDPSKSRVEIRFQTGTTDQPEVLYRTDAFNQAVEWICSDAIYTATCKFDGQAPRAVDRRPDSPTYLDTVDLDDPTFRLDAREIYSALSPLERFALRIPRQPYVDGTIDEKEKARVQPDIEFWSGAQPATNGGILVAPGGRPYFQLRLDFYNDAPTATRVVRNLRFEYDTPQAANDLLAEVAPSVGAYAGQDTIFVLALQPTLAAGSTGFNRIQVKTPARITAVEGVSISAGAGATALQRIALGDTLAPLPGAGQYKELALEDGYFVVAVPRVTRAQGATSSSPVIKIRFRGRVLNFNTTFVTSVFLDTVAVRYRADYTDNGLVVLDSTAAGLDTLALVLPQRAASTRPDQSVADLLATEGLEDRNSLTVTADITRQGGELVDNVVLSSNPFTPNHDNVNDELEISYDVLRLISASPVEVGVYDLSGRPVKSLRRREAISGGYTDVWDGTDTQGNLVPPGLYLLRIAANADDRQSVSLKVVGVAY